MALDHLEPATAVADRLSGLIRMMGAEAESMGVQLNWATLEFETELFEYRTYTGEEISSVLSINVRGDQNE